jgi:hypothetical protein
VRIEAAEKEGKARYFFVVANGSAQTARVKVRVESEALKEHIVELKLGKDELLGKQETGVEIVINTAGLGSAQVYAGTITVDLHYEVGGDRRLFERDFELWMRTA